MAAFALGLIGGKVDGLAVERLLAALGDSDSLVRARAAEALGRVGGPRAAPALAAFVLETMPQGAPQLTIRGDDPANPADPWVELRLGLLALARLKEPQALASVLLRSGEPRFDWWAATYAAAWVESPLLRPFLLAATSASDPFSRVLAARGLGALGDRSSVGQLERLTRDPDEAVAIEALRALAAIGDARGTQAAATVLRANRPTIVREALRALATLPPDATLRTRVVPFLGDPEPWTRAAGFLALARTAPNELPLVLSGLDPDPVFWVRSAKASALGQAGDDISLGILHGLLADADPRVLPAVLAALAEARRSDAAPTLLEHLKHPDVAVRAQAATSLGTLAFPDASAALVEAYAAAVADYDLAARLAILAALAAQRTPEAEATLQRAASQDPVRAVRARAAALLADHGVTPPSPGSEGLAKGTLDYQEAMAPYDNRPGWGVYTPRAVIHTRRGPIEIHLNILEAPLASGSFMALARRGFYDGLTFHSVVAHSLVVGGCPRGDGHGGPGYVLRDEPGEYPFGRGAVGLTRSVAGTAGSQLFITLNPQPHRDGRDTLLGRVVDGMDVVEQLRPGDTIQRIEIWDGR
jgi:cyclophilin family peptidyl-prolyl cis-trans isomerase/HEAT repeat protein